MAKLNEDQTKSLNRIYKYYDQHNIRIDKEKYGIDQTPHRMFSFFLFGEFGPKRWYSYSQDLTQENLKNIRSENRSKLIDDPHGSFAALSIKTANLFQEYFHKHDSEWFTSPDIIRGIIGQIELEWIKNELCKYQYSIQTLQQVANRIKLYASFEKDEYFYKGFSTRFIKMISLAKNLIIESLKEEMENYYTYGKAQQIKNIRKVAIFTQEIILTTITSQELQNDNDGRYQELINFTLNTAKQISTKNIIDDFIKNKKSYNNQILLSPLIIPRKNTAASEEEIVINFLSECNNFTINALKKLNDLNLYALGQKFTHQTTNKLRKEKPELPISGNLIPDNRFHHSGLQKRQFYDRQSLDALINIHKAFLTCSLLISYASAVECFLDLYGENRFNDNKNFKKSIYSRFDFAINNLIKNINVDKSLNLLRQMYVRNKRDDSFLRAAQKEIGLTTGLKSKGSIYLIRELVDILLENKNNNKVNTSGVEVGDISEFTKSQSKCLHTNLVSDEIMQLAHTHGDEKDVTLLAGSAAALTYIIYKGSLVSKLF